MSARLDDAMATFGATRDARTNMSEAVVLVDKKVPNRFTTRTVWSTLTGYPGFHAKAPATGIENMATQAERIATLEAHYEHLDKMLTAISSALAEVARRLDRIEKAIADDRVERSETKLRIALRVTGWLVGIVTTVLGAVVGGLFLVARLLLPKLEKLASLAHDAAPLVG